MRNVPHLRSVREERALSQRALAAMSSVAHDTIGQLERGERQARPSTIRKLAEALGVEPSVLLADAEEVEPRVRSDFLPLVGHDELTVTEFFKRVDNDNLSDAELKERARKSRIALQRAVQESYDTFREHLHLAHSQGQQEERDRSLATGDKSLANRYKQYATPRGGEVSPVWREWQERHLKEAEWQAAGKWAEYYVSGEAAYIPKRDLSRDTEPTEQEKREIRSDYEALYLQNTLMLPSGTDDEEFTVLRLKLDSRDIGEIAEVAQKTIHSARNTLEALHNKQVSFENIPVHYSKEPNAQRRIETLRTALQQYRGKALGVVNELLTLHAEAIHRLDESVDEMRKEGEKLIVHVHKADI